ncbi:hypothetical protein PanWU01x14_150390 [Parasponia andersonii]|uniref:Uncharacterized protein n=1 Tax=Parasponia andersonii TaxID=3476 RepID=A0A2P5CI53_PARAD|nr:hypothetical protein PanWU01x14_150390 [Parasponia andersonii]
MKMSRVPYASVVRSLTFAMICTRPDIAQAVRMVSRCMTNPGGEHWNAVKKILRYIKETSDVALCYGGSEFIIRGYVDSDFAKGVISWILKLKIVVALSTIETEHMVVTEAFKEAIWVQRLLEELGHKQEKISLFRDSQSTLHIARNLVFHSKTKHIGVQYHFIRVVVEDGRMDMKKIHNKENLLDALTKPFNTDKFQWCRFSYGLADTYAA